jgi:uncharacterized protein (TIRG00374 family)
MAVLTPRFLKRGLQIFALISVLGLVALLIYSGAWSSTLGAVAHLRAGWLLLALLLASLDWFGGGLRLWILTRHVSPGVRYLPMVMAGGLNTWASYLTPSQTGGGPVMIYAMKRGGVPLPEALTASLMSFVATIVFFAIVGPLAIVLGGGHSLRQHGIPVVGLTFYDVFRASAGVFLTIGAVLFVIIALPGVTARLFHALIGRLERRPDRAWADKVAALRSGVDRTHDCIVAYVRTPSGWLAIAGGVLTSALAHANKLCAGYVVLRALGIEAQVVDVLMLQTAMMFLLYFAPTPGGSGAAEALAAALMSVYVSNALLPAYTILWRLTVSYGTVAAGSVVFYRLLHGRLDEAESGTARREP